MTWISWLLGYLGDLDIWVTWISGLLGYLGDLYYWVTWISVCLGVAAQLLGFVPAVLPTHAPMRFSSCTQHYLTLKTALF